MEEGKKENKANKIVKITDIWVFPLDTYVYLKTIKEQEYSETGQEKF